MNIALLNYSNTANIGDNIQTLAVAQHIDQEYSLVDRDFLHRYDGEPCVVVMNGWFTHEPQNWPPAPAITPIFFGFHLTPKVAPGFEKHKAYFERFAPIGCRDQATADIIKSWGVDAYMSGCATMTFPARKNEPAEPKVILVDQKQRHFARSERKQASQIGHIMPFPIASEVRFEAAKNLLDFYRLNAGLVVTSRIHSAMPCAAMGIPVVYTGRRDGRTAIIDMIGIPSVRTKLFPRTRIEGFPVRQPAFDDVKKRITSDLHARLEAHGVKVKVPTSL
ncbi:hypothetical protein GCM10010869_46280 [Mesorhizobium tianshanense]|uniref:Polysaccharide pyruvyl transferase n=1 Tax=Mesorhizobium tianshanense TaxID=39844 RepID=A0A562M8K4_9HYPH|nr:polysaccharide pyruvyl transferase family protein [Mesorhizobium tianshanense]TWI16233.1 polysaccharide pyruvyl transferase [Mesorhizobium tianshanense]GLS39031.1 hypothetical protein GCM10010869_46280 [Mesorhizobium tianshanense]